MARKSRTEILHRLNVERQAIPAASTLSSASEHPNIVKGQPAGRSAESRAFHTLHPSTMPVRPLQTNKLAEAASRRSLQSVREEKRLFKMGLATIVHRLNPAAKLSATERHPMLECLLMGKQ